MLNGVNEKWSRNGLSGVFLGSGAGTGVFPVKKVCGGWRWLTGSCGKGAKKDEKKLAENLEKSEKR